MTNRRSAWIVAGAGAVVLGVLAFALWYDPPGLIGEPKQEVPAEQERPVEEPTEVIIYTPVYEGMELHFAQHLEVPPSGADPKLFAVSRYLKEVQDVAPGLSASSISVIGSEALVDLSGPLDTGFSTMEEAMLVNGLRAALGQFEEVESVTLLHEGEAISTLGALDLSVPQPVLRPHEVTDDPS